MRRCALLLLAAVVLSGCAVLSKQELKPVPKTLTHGRFVYLADRACARDIRRSKRALKQKPKNQVQYDRKLNEVLKGYEQALFDLRSLAPPPSAAEEFRHLLAAFNYQDLLGHNLLQAGDLGQARKVKALIKKLEVNDINLKSRALELGLKTCAGQ